MITFHLNVEHAPLRLNHMISISRYRFISNKILLAEYEALRGT